MLELDMAVALENQGSDKDSFLSAPKGSTCNPSCEDADTTARVGPVDANTRSKYWIPTLRIGRKERKHPTERAPGPP